MILMVISVLWCDDCSKRIELFASNWKEMLKKERELIIGDKIYCKQCLLMEKVTEAL